MTPIKIVFMSNETLIVWSADAAAFTESVLAAKPPEIRHLEYADVPVNDVPELTDVKLTFASGAMVLCQLPTDQLPKARYIPEIVECDVTNVIAYAKMGREEAALDARFAAASAVINNVPDLEVRVHLHKEYMKRKQAYVSAVEALVDGALRRPTE